VIKLDSAIEGLKHFPWSAGSE